MDFTECDCTDGFDNNADGVVDCADQFCALFDPACTGGGATEVDCVNLQDDDGDGLIDCDDTDCSADPNCLIVGTEICSDGGDNDGDGDIDCADSDCVNSTCCSGIPVNSF